MMSFAPLHALILAILAISASLTTLAAPHTPVPTANVSDPTGKITFAAIADPHAGNYEIFSINADGTHKTQLTHDNAQDWAPSWSPDGKKIAYLSNKDNNVYHVYVMDADGAHVTQLTYRPESTQGTFWSPDGKKIAFSSWRDGNGEIYVMNADGTQQTNVTNNPADDVFPAWSPDSAHLIFMSRRATPIAAGTADSTINWQIYVMNADGSHVRPLTGDLSSTYAYPRWSPEGKRVAWLEIHPKLRGAASGGITIRSLINGTKIQLPYDGTFDSPAWSPDGNYIAATHRVFNSDNSIRKELNILGVNTNQAIPLVTDGDPEVPNWSPTP